MDVQAASARGQAGSAGVLRPVELVRRRAPNQDLHRARASMGHRESLDNPLDMDPVLVSSVLSYDDEPVVRRRSSSSTSTSTVTSHDAEREMVFVRQLSKDIRKETDSGVNKGGREMRKRGYSQQLIDALINRHHGYYRILRALAGGSTRATDAQSAQAFALCVFDVNREVCLAVMIGNPEPDESLRLLVCGAKRLTGFNELLPMIELWSRIRFEANPTATEREVMRLTLVNSIGLFETNARRFLNAYDEAASAGNSSVDIIPRMRSCLVKQWMCGVSDEEREALRHASGEQCAEFHRKLMQQYALLCRHFGQPLPPLSELILVDHDD